MTRALYYPHSTLRNRSLLRNALLLWDRVDCITPETGLRPFRFGVPVYDAATDLLVKNHVPTKNERLTVHKLVEDLVKKGVPSWLKLGRQSDLRVYQLYPGKLEEATWELLSDNSLARLTNLHDDYEVAEPLGLLLMAALAHACGGEYKRKITDRAAAYENVNQLATAIFGGDYLRDSAASRAAPVYNRLVTISLRVVDTDSIPIQRLLDFRNRELREGGDDYRKLRLKYLGIVDEYVNKLVSTTESHHRRDIESDFLKDMRGYVHDLKVELRMNRLKTLFTRDIAVAALAAVGVVIPASTVVGSGVGVMKAGLEMSGTKRNILLGNGMSWLYLARERRFGVPYRFKLDREA